jgi:tetratricopeptide (TPR) repeat protein
MSNVSQSAGIREGQPAPAASFFDRQTGAFFRRTDWGAFWTVWIIAFSLYIYTAAPSVTLEDSGELSVAADYMGVPHPPGYPLWSLLAWFFQWVFHGVSYHGYPNTAWPIIVMSSTFASLACGFLALLVSRSGADMLRGMKQLTDTLGLKVESKICWTAGVTAGLMLAFSPVLWSQAVIVEVYALNCFFLIVLLLMTYRWMSRPGEDWALYALAYLFGLGLTNHHTIFFVGPGFFLAALFRDIRLWRDAVAVISVGIAGLLLFSGFRSLAATSGAVDTSVYLNILFGVGLLLVPLVLFMVFRALLTEWRRLFTAAGALVLGLSFYLYMPIASEQNPPHNWGNARTWEGFIHSLTRGQYERISPSDIFADFGFFADQIATYVDSVRTQFTLPMMLLALIPFFFLPAVHRRTRLWFYTLLTAFFFVSIVLVMFLNPTLDIQTLFIQRRFLILSHAIYAIWLGYSIVFILSMMEIGFLRFKLWSTVRIALLGLAFMLPASILHSNFYNEEKIKIIGGAEQRGHYFGWQFGHWQLEGVHGIRADLERLYGPDAFPDVWEDYPNPDYPPRILEDAIVFGGTDPGRFVPTYMIFSARSRPDLYLITQNALADNTYMAVMRDLYGDRIWIPSQADSNIAFQQYVRDVEAGRIPAGADVVEENGRVSVQGVAGVMMINGILCRMIFEENKHQHPFYVEESYVIEWMYPYMEPHGLIFRLHPEPVELTQEMVDNDMAFWKWYTARLLSHSGFIRDINARKSFSKLRSALAGWYVNRNRLAEAEIAFRESIDLYPLSPEACFRLAHLYRHQSRLTEAREVIAALLEGDSRNEGVAEFHAQLENMERMDMRRQEIEAGMGEEATALETILELAELYVHLQLPRQFHNLAAGLLQDDSIPLPAYQRIGQLAAASQNVGIYQFALERQLVREPRSPAVLIDLAALFVATDRADDAMPRLRQAIQFGGMPVIEAIRMDERFAPLHERNEFRMLVPLTPPPARTGSTGFGLSP